MKARPHLPGWWTRNPEDLLSTLKKNLALRLSKTDCRSLKRVIELAQNLHRDQSRAGGEPYIVHPYRVALSMMLELDVVDADLITAALLHDVLEDSSLTEEDLQSKVGPRVKEIVATVTRSTKRAKTGDTIEDAYFQKIIDGGPKSVLLKLADKLDNLRDALHHPNVKNRQLYIREGYEVFLP